MRRRSSSAPARPCSRRVPSLGVICVDEEHDSVVQAGVGSALRRAHRRGEARRARGRGRDLRLRDAAAGVVGGARAARARRPDRGADADGAASSTCAARRAIRSRRRSSPSSAGSRSAAARRSCSSTGAASRPRSTAARAARRGAARTATSRSRSTATASLRCHHCGAREPLGETCPACGSAELARIGAGTQKLERELEKHVPELERIRLDADAVVEAGAAARGARAVRARRSRRPRRHADGREGAPLLRRRARRGRRRRHRASGCPTSAPRSGRSSSSRSSPAAAAATRRAACIVQTFQPDSRAVAYAARHDVARLPRGELERRRALGYPPFRHLVRIVVSGPELADAMRALEELKAGPRRLRAARPGAAAAPARPPPRAAHRQDRPARARSRRAPPRCSPPPRPAMRRAGLTAVVDVDPQSL